MRLIRSYSVQIYDAVSIIIIEKRKIYNCKLKTVKEENRTNINLIDGQIKRKETKNRDWNQKKRHQRQWNFKISFTIFRVLFSYLNSSQPGDITRSPRGASIKQDLVSKQIRTPLRAFHQKPISLVLCREASAPFLSFLVLPYTLFLCVSPCWLMKSSGAGKRARKKRFKSNKAQGRHYQWLALLLWTWQLCSLSRGGRVTACRYWQAVIQLHKWKNEWDNNNDGLIVETLMIWSWILLLLLKQLLPMLTIPLLSLPFVTQVIVI